MPVFSGDIEIENGNVIIKASGDDVAVTLDAEQASIEIGGDGRAGKLSMSTGDNVRTIQMNGERGDLTLGGQGRNGGLTILDAGGDVSMQLDGDSGDIRLQGADCAEEFDLSTSAELEPGTVLVIDRNTKLCRSTEAYDRRVAGVVSGAGNCRPGIILDRKKSCPLRAPVALTGKVFCKVDAQDMSIAVGDLLTTSYTPGHAMKADDASRAFGAVIGKALASAQNGCRLIPILVALQ